MRLRERNLVDEIRSDALDDDVPLARTLRKVIALGGDVGSTELREWASLELQGHGGIMHDEIPEYRKVPSAILIDGATINALISRQQISRFDFPEEIRDKIEESVTFTQGVGELEALAKRARDDGAVRLALPGNTELAKIMTYEMQKAGGAYAYQTVQRVYWEVGEPSITGILDAIRTTLVELVSEIRAGTPDTAVKPSAEVADQAVNIVVKGIGKRIVNVAQVSGDGGGHDVNAASPTPERRSRWRTIGAFIVGVATIVGAVIAVFAWQGWGV